jgi:preprotein translocase subunit YajC
MSQQIAPLLFLLSNGSSPLGSPLILMVLMLALAYFLLIVPQRKQQRAVAEMQNNLKPGDKVVTNGGLHGTVVSLREDKRTVQLKISDNPVVRIEVSRTAIAGLQEAQEEKK